ncbi:hypothetical protein [Roseitalea porphyridii]|uniref:Uncharacterized protein n=1 Tax=Roseitalea porphyridii TaxID=1852022 RepID=A0A4P6V4C6_9HYPH|nr:hypothetical protein [Roseitalea porphyridii]QBK31664.1 hypothetical protein E0E05_14265 [Roseitalea porphyridii]
MADFAAILKKTLDKMGETTPQMRAKVYDKARQTVQRQIDAMATRPPQVAIDRQFAKLDEAIAEIEAEHAGAAAPEPAPGPVADDFGSGAQEAPVAPREPDEPAPAEEPQPEEPPVDAILGAGGDETGTEPPPAAVPQDDSATIAADLPPGEEPAPPSRTEPAMAEPESWSEDTADPGEAPAAADDDDAVRAEETEPAPVDSVFGASGDETVTTPPPPADPDEPTVDDVIASFDRTDTGPDEGSRVEPSFDAPETEDAAAPALPRAEADDPLLDFLNEQRDTLAGNDDQGQADADRAADMLFGEAGETIGTTPAPSGAGAEQPMTADRADDAPARDQMADTEPSRGPRWGLLAIVVVLVGLLAGGGYAAYSNQGPIRAFLADFGIELPEIGDGAGTVSDEDGVPVRTVETMPVEGDETTSGEDATTDDAGADEPAETVNAGGTDEAVQKFTQRLTEDGREVDEGPAPGGPATGEGSTVAGQTVAGEGPVAGDDATTAPEDEGAGDEAVAVGQRTIFYEERTGTQPGTAIQGSTVWSVAQVSPGGDLPVEPAIRAESAIPELGLTLEMTVRRNGDATFPASHIVELFFSVPATFEGRGIADVQRITFKNTEQDPGSALIAVPAPIDTNIFLVALTDADTAVQTNTSLMLSQGWIDIPMQYVSGRRALITLEKGAAGDRVFNEVFEAWEENPLGEASGG